MSVPEVTIVIPTQNGAETLPALFDAIDAQDDAAPREVIVVDSGSTDATIALASARADSLVRIPRSDFNHGTTRNLGIARAHGSLVVLVVQDARPVGRQWLAALLAPLRADPRVAGVFARQVPLPDATALTRFSLDGWVASTPHGRVVEIDRATFEELPSLGRLDRCAFDNVCSALRRTAWQAIPFEQTSIAEDLAWGRAVLLAGYRIAFEPRAVVEHSHDRPARYELARTWALHQRLYHLFGIRTVPSVPALARSIAVTARTHAHVLRRAGVAVGSAEWRRAMRLAVAWPAAQFLGGWTAAHGRDHWRLRGA